MHRFVSLALALLFLTACSDCGDSRPPGGGDDASIDGDSPDGPARLSVSGKRVLDPDGVPIVLRGYNWGQWGTMQPEDAAANVAQGANSVRIPLRWWGEWKPGVNARDDAAVDTALIDPAHLAMLDDMMQRASDAHLWIVLFVDSNYGQGADGRTDNFWTNAAEKARFIAVWELIVKRYRDLPYIAAWEILPEPKPTGFSNADVRAFYDSVIPHIRALDPRTPIVVGPNGGYHVANLEDAYSTADSQIIYTANYFIFDHPLARMDEFTDFRDAHDVPIWVNQVGVETGDTDAAASAAMVLGAFEAEDIGFAWWTYRLNNTNSQTHGIFYLDETETSWVVKQSWFDLVGSYLD